MNASCVHRWTPYQAEGLTFNTRCATCGELAVADRDELEDAEEEGAPVDIDDDTQAERYLEWLRYRNGKIVEISQRMDAEIARLKARKGQLLSGHRQRADYLEAALKKYLWESGQKRIDYAYGTLSRRRGRERVEVEDDYAFCFKYGDNADLVATTRRPDKLGIKAHIKSTGDIPDGADLVRGDDTCTITLTEGAAP